MSIRLQLATLIITVLICSCSLSNAPEISSEKSLEVLNHHLAAIGEGDLERVMSDYTEESVIITQDNTYTGLQQIREFFIAILPAFPAGQTNLEIDTAIVENELVYITWKASSPSLYVPFGTDTFIIENGKIKRQTFAGVIHPNETGSWHIAVNEIPPNPVSGFTNVYGKGGMSIGYLDVPGPMDFTPLFKGLPQDMCPSPHWGYVLEGSLEVFYPDGKTDLIKAGEVFYLPAPHTGVVEKNVKFIDFSPDSDFIPLMDHIANVMKGQSGD